MVAAIVGEGGSGGAIALAAANRVLMFEHAVYAVISPEGCASILWRTAEKAGEAATAMQVTAQDLKSAGCDRPDRAGTGGRCASRLARRDCIAGQGYCRGTGSARQTRCRQAADATCGQIPQDGKLIRLKALDARSKLAAGQKVKIVTY